jgi:hypothetical protein
MARTVAVAAPAGRSCTTLSSIGSPRTLGHDHWKISVVQSPFCRRTSWRAPARRAVVQVDEEVAVDLHPAVGRS